MSGMCRIRCLECEATELVDADADHERNKRRHREDHCPNAEFEVTYL